MRTAVALVLLACAPPIEADVWPSLHGEWRGGGTVRGTQAEVSLSFRPVLDAAGNQLSFRNRMLDAGGKEWLFQAEAIYLCTPEPPCRGHWFDSRGVILPLTAMAGTRTLVVEWGDTASERGRSTYELQSDGAMRITDEVVDEGGGWRTFGQTRVLRVGKPGLGPD